MGYYMRFLVTDPAPLTLRGLQAGLGKSKDASFRVEGKGAAGDLYFGEELLGELELNRKGTELADEELEELREAVGKDADPRVLKTLKGCRVIVAVRVLWQGRDPESTLSMLDPLWEWLFETRKGLLQADGEGYYDSDELIFEEEA